MEELHKQCLKIVFNIVKLCILHFFICILICVLLSGYFIWVFIQGPSRGFIKPCLYENSDVLEFSFL